MDGFLSLASAMQPTIDVGDTTCVAGYDQRSAAGFNIADLPFQHFIRDERMFDRKNAPKTTAFFTAGQFDNLGIFECAEQLARLAIDAQLAK